MAASNCTPTHTRHGSPGGPGGNLGLARQTAKSRIEHGLPDVLRPDRVMVDNRWFRRATAHKSRRETSVHDPRSGTAAAGDLMRRPTRQVPRRTPNTYVQARVARGCLEEYRK